VTTIAASDELSIFTTHELPPTKLHELRLMWLHATRSDTNAIGFLPVSAFDARAATDEVTTVYRNGDLVGWAMAVHSRHTGVMRIYQIWVRPDARILEHGRALIDAISMKAVALRCFAMRAWVAEDLPANLFWQALGFQRMGWRWGRGEKPRKHILWHVPILKPKGATNGRIHT
jgi:ribosomal protein S18 acetylase RimI-like enzyme